jgi:protein subunit release factor A
VAVLDVTTYKEVDIHPGEVDILYTKGDGNGGQHRDKTMSCVIMTHLATGIKVKVDGRDQHKNKREAFKRIKVKVNHFYRTGNIEEVVEERREQIGNGLRGDKRRTYCVYDKTVTDHLTGKSCHLKNFMKGNLELLQ